MSDFSGKSVMVLGGSRGIGAAIVRHFAGAGAKVLFSYSGSPDAAATVAAETGATAVKADSANRDELIAAVAAAGALDIMVINAGVGIMGRSADDGSRCSGSADRYQCACGLFCWGRSWPPDARQWPDHHHRFDQR